MASTAMVRAERLSATLKRVKEEAKNTTRRSISAGATLGGAAAAGLLDAKFPTVGSSNVPASVVGGLVALGAGLFGLLDEHSDHLVAAGAGALAPYVRDEVKAFAT
jgi:predicted transcriptional regulator